MSETSNRAEAVAPVRFEIPVALWLLAIFAGLLHMAPYWRAQSQTPPGWTFTGTLFNSP